MNEQLETVPTGMRGIVGELHDWVETVMVAVVVAILVFTFIARVIGVVGDSMEPTLHNGERLVISRLAYQPKTGDIVVVTKPNVYDEPLIKRVIAAEGQTVDIDFETGLVTVDGEVLEEDYIAEITHLQYDLEFPQTVPAGHVFVMGDNRNNSWDSRDSRVGMIDERYIFGRVLYRILPIDQLGLVE